MPTIIPVKFTYAARDLWFDPAGTGAQEADHVICSTERGTEIGLATADAREVSEEELEHVIESGGQWADVKSQQLPKLEKGVAYFKTKRTMTENLAYAAAAGNKGCYVGLFVVLFVIIFLIVSFFIFR